MTFWDTASRAACFRAKKVSSLGAQGGRSPRRGRGRLLPSRALRELLRAPLCCRLPVTVGAPWLVDAALQPPSAPGRAAAPPWSSVASQVSLCRGPYVPFLPPHLHSSCFHRSPSSRNPSSSSAAVCRLLIPGPSPRRTPKGGNPISCTRHVTSVQLTPPGWSCGTKRGHLRPPLSWDGNVEGEWWGLRCPQGTEGCMLVQEKFKGPRSHKVRSPRCQLTEIFSASFQFERRENCRLGAWKKATPGECSGARASLTHSFDSDWRLSATL